MQYAEYVWSCYFVTGFILFYQWLRAYRQHRRILGLIQEEKAKAKRLVN